MNFTIGKNKLVCRVIDNELSIFNSFPSFKKGETEDVIVTVVKIGTESERCFEAEDKYKPEYLNKNFTFKSGEDGEGWYEVKDLYDVIMDNNYVHKSLKSYEVYRLLEARKTAFI